MRPLRAVAVLLLPLGLGCGSGGGRPSDEGGPLPEESVAIAKDAAEVRPWADAAVADMAPPAEAAFGRTDVAAVSPADARADLAAAPPSDARASSPEPPVTCKEYCPTLGGNCYGANRQEWAQGNCEPNCPRFGWSPGSPNDEQGNTLGCRLRYARLAKTEPARHCKAAGASGGGICGTPCEAYCQGALGNCAGRLYPDVGTCLAACGQMPLGAPGDKAGNTVHCRLFWIAQQQCQSVANLCR